MSDWRAQKALSERLFSHTRSRLELALEDHAWPLPEPPLSDPDFPVRPPSDPGRVRAMALALFDANRASFERDLEEIGQALVPHRLSLTADPAREARKWLDRRADEVAERALCKRLEAMLGQALDPDAPDDERWWAAIAMLDGFSMSDSVVARQQGYHLLESVALARPPGRWHGRAAPGPHLLDWSEGMSTEGETLSPNGNGVYAAGWLLDRMESADPPRPVLVEWLDLAMARVTLVAPLNILARLTRMASDGETTLAARIAALLPRAWDLDEVGAAQLEQVLLSREVEVRRMVADALEEIIQRRAKDGLPLLSRLLSDPADEVVTIATGALRLVPELDPAAFESACVDLAAHCGASVRRRFAQTALRDYMVLHPDDCHGLLVSLWLDGDEVTRSRLRELLLGMCEVAPDAFANHLARIRGESSEHGLDPDTVLADLWRLMSVRDAPAGEAWRLHIEAGGPRP